MSKKELLKRYTLLVVSLFIGAVGVALSKRGELGLSPVSSIANVMSVKFDETSFGLWLVVWNLLLIAGQIALLRKDFKPIQLLQVPMSMLFGVFTNIGVKIVAPIQFESYIGSLSLVVWGVVLCALSIALSLLANVIMGSNEAFVRALADTIKKDFSTVKVVFDIACAFFAVALSLIFFHTKVIGMREGTILSAVCTGFIVKIILKHIKKPVDKLLREDILLRPENN